MDLDKLKSFIAVAELNSFTAASKSVNLTQSAVSQQLRELERETGFPLLDRSRRPVSLTKEGANLLKSARTMISIWEDFKEQHRKKEISGELLVGYIRSAVNSIFAQAIRHLREKYPQMNIKLVNTGGVSKHLAQMVGDGEIDVSLGVGPLQMPKGVLWRPISLERYYVIAPPEYTGGTDEELLLEGPYLRFKPFKLQETIIDKAMKRRGLQLPAFMELDAYDSIIMMVNHNLGVGIVPEPYIDTRVLYEFRCHPFCTPQLTRESGLMVRYDNENMHLATLLWETLQLLYNKKKSEFKTSR
ncbi:LysR family transcriptional regulator [Desulfospira joergensenii]|uniref:LysR family transcriptional regulator n=1 Tax=Desulfospira joergensenii TaxID=53329 RepID=UPI0003B5BBAC|nr:LysR family transcriptional regulator [Desulfospira joergensenii]